MKNPNLSLVMRFALTHKPGHRLLFKSYLNLVFYRMHVHLRVFSYRAYPVVNMERLATIIPVGGELYAPIGRFLWSRA